MSRALSSTTNRPSSSLRPERARHQVLDRLVDAELTLEDGGDRARDRHFYSQLLCQFHQGGSRRYALREPGLATGLRQRQGAAERHPEREIARLRARAGENEVAQARKPGQGLRPGAKGSAEAEQLGEAAGGQCGGRTGAKA